MILTEDEIKYKKLENLKCELFNDNFENFHNKYTEILGKRI